MLSWARHLPFDGEPADVAEIVTAYGAWLGSSAIPKCFVRSVPGTMAPNALAACRAWPVQHAFTAHGRHYPQEDTPDEVGQALTDGMHTLD